MFNHVALIIDPPRTLNIEHDSSLAIIIACHRRGIRVAVVEPHELWVTEGNVYGHVAWLTPTFSYEAWYQNVRRETVAFSHLDCIIMRKDPPCTINYYHITQILSLAKRAGIRVVNDPDALRLLNEKWVIEQFPQCIAPTLIAADQQQIKQFIEQYQEVVLKPLDGMGGRGIFRLRHGDVNTNTILETMQMGSSSFIMVQQYLPAIQEGDKRILILHGQAFPYALARIPQAGDFRGNLAAGGRGEVRPLSKRDIWLVEQVSPFLQEWGLNLVGLDVIGDYLTEINITSPTCIRELDQACQADLAGQWIENF